MRACIGRFLCRMGVAVGVLMVFTPRVLAVDTMADWIGLNNTPPTTGVWPEFDSQVLGPTGTAPHHENFVVISPTSIGGTVQAKINYNQSPNREEPLGTSNVNFPHLYLADQTLDGPTLDFTTPLHMEGTISWDTPSDVAVEPNFCFCWYNSADTRHRIGIGISNVVESPFTPNPDSLRIDLGYAASPANKFYYVTADGTLDQTGTNSRLPDGTYHFTFDYTPGDFGNPTGGSVSATVTDATHNYHYTRSPLENDPWNNDFFTLDRFGIVIRSTGSTTNQGDYQLTISNVTYTGGTAIAGVPGDYNGNGVVDAADYVLWRDGGSLQNEVDNPGTVGPGDYTEWRARFGNTSGSGSGLGTGAVPEPTAVLLAVLTSFATLNLRRGRS